jgi:hypothetical protein
LKLFNNESYDIIYQEIRNTGISLIFIREFDKGEKKAEKAEKAEKRKRKINEINDIPIDDHINSSPGRMHRYAVYQVNGSVVYREQDKIYGSKW